MSSGAPRVRSWQPLSGCRWPDVALMGISINLAWLLAAPLARPDLHLLDKALSYYATGPWGVAQTIAFMAMGIASIALGVGLFRSPPSSRWTAVVVASLIAAGTAALGLVAYPMGVPSPHTFLGDAHQTAGTVGGVAQLVAALAFTIAVWSDRRWRPLFLPSVAAFGLASIGALLTQIEIWRPDLGIPMGATMRLVVVPLVLLWAAVALRLRHRCLRPVSRPAAAT